MGTQTGSISFETANGLKSYASQNYATLSQIKGQFAISNSSASEINKTATIVPANSNWTLYSGATITVKFVNKNTAAASPPPELTLNVNNTGAKTIKDYAGNQLQQASSKWEDKTTMVLTYDGTNWRIQDTNIMERIHSMDSSIEQTATSIVSLVSNQDYYITPDGTTGENTIKSTFTQQANAIDARVEKDGVIAAINASVEEIEGITGSSLQIQADKVNIAGAAIFTNNGRLSETSLNNTYSPISTTTTAVYRIQRIYYRATEAQSNLTGPTTWLSISGTGYGNWSTSIPQLINNGTKYSFLYTCTQTQTVAQANSGTTCTCSEVLLDNSTTVIDGGSIITNSINANKISISDISALEATIGGFEIDDTSIHTRQIGVTSNADNSIALSSVDFTRTINNIPRSGLRFAMGDKFAVTGDGTVYASGITISESQVAGLTGDLIDAKKHTQVIVSANNINYLAVGNETAATLTAILYIDGNVTTSGVTYQWYKDGTIISLNGTSQNLTVTGTMGLSHLYTCTCTWT